MGPTAILQECFARFFDEKIKTITTEVSIDQDVHNGRVKVGAMNKMFMGPISVKEVMSTLKVKNSEGFNRIPQRIIVDRVNFLAPNFA